MVWSATRRALALTLLATALGLAGAAPALATTVVSGTSDSSSPLLIDPRTSPTDALQLRLNVGAPAPVAFIERMPATKTIQQVGIGDFQADQGDCPRPMQLSLYVREHAAGDADQSNQIAYATVTPNAPASPRVLTWTLNTPITLQAGLGYSFRVQSTDPGSCRFVYQTTWAHNGAQVEGGTNPCASGPTVGENPAPLEKRMWHAANTLDGAYGPNGCAGTSFDPRMPTGWLVSIPSGVGWDIATGFHVPGTPLPPGFSACNVGSNTDLTDYGAEVVDWSAQAADGNEHFLCRWKQFVALGGQADDGWYYGLPWRIERKGAPRDVYLAVGTPSRFQFPISSNLSGQSNAGAKNLMFTCVAEPVNCATGNFWESYKDLRVGGLGVGLDLTRTSNSQAAATASSPGPFGYGWSASFRDWLEFPSGTTDVIVHHSNGSTVPFSQNADGSYSAPGWVQSTLTKNQDATYTYVLPDQRTFSFASSGKLTGEADRNGNKTTLTYSGNNLSSVTDPAGRSLSFTYNGDGTVATATDPGGHQTSYAYSAGNLTSVTDVGGGTTKFGYDGSHQITTVTDARNDTVITNVYDASNRVTSQTDALSRTTQWSYLTNETKITDPAGNVTDEQFTHSVPTQVTRAQGTPAQATTALAYDANLNPVQRTDPNGHVWQYSYDAAGNLSAVTDPLNRSWSYAYDSKRDVTSVTKPSGQKISLGYDANGNLTSVRRTLTETGAQQTTTLGYDALGERTRVSDPLNRAWSYAYDSQGDRTSATSPLGRKTTFGFDRDSFETSLTAARGNDAGAKPANFTTSIARNAFELPTTITDANGHQTSYRYDATQNLTDLTDRDGRHSTIAFDVANHATQVTRGDGSAWKASYNPDGRIATQTDGLGHTTSYMYDAQERLASITDPLNRTQTFGYDAAGNRTSIVDQQNRTTTLRYDAANEPTALTFSSGNPSAVGFGYDADGRRTTMTDATGTTAYAYDSLGRLTGQTSGAGQKTGYGYDLADELTSIAYPPALTALSLGGGQQQVPVPEGSVTRSYDNDGNLASVTDWLNHKTSFGYDSDNNLTGITRPNNVSASYTYDTNDALTAVTDAGVTTTLGRTAEELLQSSATSRAGATHYGYDGAQRLTAAGPASYQYDAGDNLTQVTAQGASIAQSFDSANELAKTTAGQFAITYSYDPSGNRIGAADASGALHATYSFDRANRLIGYSGPPHNAPPQQTVQQQYVYDGDGLRQTKTTNNVLTTETYDLTQGLPLMLEDGPTAYVTGPRGLPLEQVSQDGTVRYFSHDQLGSTTALTDQNGTAVARYSYDAYGNSTRAPSAVQNPFGYAGQYTDPETGLQYLRARYYDPMTGQFLTRDPISTLTRQPYSYARDNPANLTDASGQDALPGIAGGADAVCAGTWEVPGVDVVTCGAAGLATAAAGAVAIHNAIAGDSNDTTSQDAPAEPPSCGPSAPPNFADPSQPPGAGWEWKGDGPPGSSEGSWWNPSSTESLHPDLGHGGEFGPHYDYLPQRGGPGYRVYPDGRVVPK